jgi:hypothetical protein
MDQGETHIEIVTTKKFTPHSIPKKLALIHMRAASPVDC